MITSTPYSRKLLETIENLGCLDNKDCTPSKKSSPSRKLSKKHKRLIQLSIAIVLRCDNLIINKIEKAVCAGASNHEVMETINTAIKMISLSGGAPSLIYGNQVKEYLQQRMM